MHKIIYNVTIKIDKSIELEWLMWMESEHIPELIGTGLFLSCKLCKLLLQDDTESVTFITQYLCDDINKYNNYIEQYAATMREKAFKKFGNKFIAFRTIMELVYEQSK